MVLIKTAEENTSNYIMSAPIASIRYEKALEKKGWGDAKDKSLKYAINLIKKSGVSESEVIKILEQLKARIEEIKRVLN